MDIDALINDLDLEAELPPMSEGARALLSLTEDQREDPRVLSLAAQEDPTYLGKLLSRANSVAYAAQGNYVASAEAAVRRLGTTQTYDLLLAIALASSFPESPHISWARQYLLDYTLSAGITARRTAQWLGLDEQDLLRLRLGSLLLPMGLFALLLQPGPAREQVFNGLQVLMRRSSVAFTDDPALHGYCQASRLVAHRWGAPHEVVQDIAAAGKAGRLPPEQAEHHARLLLLVQRLVDAKLQGFEQLPIVEATLGAWVRGHTSGIKKVDLGVYLGG